MSKLVAVFVSMAGVAMTTVGNMWADDYTPASAFSGKRSLVGDLFGLLSAMSYGLFTVLLKKFAGEEGERVDVQKFFGYIGLLTLVALVCLALGIEPKFSIPHSVKLEEVVLANGFIGRVLRLLLGIMCGLDNAIGGYIGMSLTIPIAMVADMEIHGRHYSVVYILGSIQVFAGFVIANISDWLTMKLGL